VVYVGAVVDHDYSRGQERWVGTQLDGHELLEEWPIRVLGKREAISEDDDHGSDERQSRR
jgi:hypothetical protein